MSQCSHRNNGDKYTEIRNCITNLNFLKFKSLLNRIGPTLDEKNSVLLNLCKLYAMAKLPKVNKIENI